MAVSRKCEICGANLDFGERCSCSGPDIGNKANESGRYYRAQPEYSEEQKLDALHNIMVLIV